MSFHFGNHAEKVAPIQQWFINSHKWDGQDTVLMCIQLYLEVLLRCSLCTFAHISLTKANHMAMPVGWACEFSKGVRGNHMKMGCNY